MEDGQLDHVTPVDAIVRNFIKGVADPASLLQRSPNHHYLAPGPTCDRVRKELSTAGALRWLCHECHKTVTAEQNRQNSIDRPQMQPSVSAASAWWISSALTQKYKAPSHLHTEEPPLLVVDHPSLRLIWQALGSRSFACVTMAMLLATAMLYLAPPPMCLAPDDGLPSPPPSPSPSPARGDEASSSESPPVEGGSITGTLAADITHIPLPSDIPDYVAAILRGMPESSRLAEGYISIRETYILARAFGGCQDKRSAEIDFHTYVSIAARGHGDETMVKFAGTTIRSMILILSSDRAKTTAVYWGESRLRRRR